MTDRRAQEMLEAFIGQVAHDLNNLLTPLLAYPELVRQELPEDGQSRHLLEVMERAAGDMTHLTRQLLSFSMKDRMPESDVDINRVVEGVLDGLCRNEMPENLNIEKRLSANLPGFTGAEDLIMNAVSNVGENAIEAMGESGTLTIVTERIMPESEEGKSGPCIRVSISDTGPGINEQLEGSVFEPFVTDKRGSKRRAPGLGLSITRRVMDEHGGTVTFSSKPGEGATFYLDFPLTE
jgi:signal transduction histidine kinase